MRIRTQTDIRKNELNSQSLSIIVESIKVSKYYMNKIPDKTRKIKIYQISKFNFIVYYVV